MFFLFFKNHFVILHYRSNFPLHPFLERSNDSVKKSGSVLPVRCVRPLEKPDQQLEWRFLPFCCTGVGAVVNKIWSVCVKQLRSSLPYVWVMNAAAHTQLFHFRSCFNEEIWRQTVFGGLLFYVFMDTLLRLSGEFFGCFFPLYSPQLYNNFMKKTIVWRNAINDNESERTQK